MSQTPSARGSHNPAVSQRRPPLVPLSRTNGLARNSRGPLERKKESLLPKVYQWLQTNNCSRRKNEGKEYTHLIRNPYLSMFGKAYVPDDKLDQFYDAYAESWDLGEHIYMVEQADHKKANVFYRMHIDMDMIFEAKTVRSDEMWTRIVRSMQNVMSAIFPGVDTTMLIGFSDASEYTCKGAKLRPELKLDPVADIITSKLGAHAHWPNVFVNAKIATAVRNRMVNHLLTNIGYSWMDDDDQETYRLLNDWASVIDINVIRNANLRMFGSRKCTPCGCPPTKCRHTDKVIDEGRVYKREYSFVVTPEGNCDADQTATVRSNSKATLLMASLRTTSTSASPNRIDSKELKFPTGRGNRQEQGRVDDSTASIVEELIHQYCGTDVPRLDSIQHHRGRGAGSIIVPLSNRFCPNLGREHHNNGVYIKVSECLAPTGTDGAPTMAFHVVTTSASSMSANTNHMMLTR